MVGLTAEQTRLYNDLKAAGVTLDSAAGQAIASKVSALYAEQTAREAATAAAEKQAEAAATANDLAKSTAGTLAHAFKDGQTGAEAFTNALDQVSDRLLDLSIDALFAKDGLGQLFTTGGQTSSGGGLLSWLSGGLGSLFGGGTGGATGAPLNLLPSFHTGRLSNREFMAVLEDSEDVVTRAQRGREAAVMSNMAGMVAGARSGDGASGGQEINVYGGGEAKVRTGNRGGKSFTDVIFDDYDKQMKSKYGLRRKQTVRGR